MNQALAVLFMVKPNDPFKIRHGLSTFGKSLGQFVAESVRVVVVFNVSLNTGSGPHMQPKAGSSSYIFGSIRI